MLSKINNQYRADEDLENISKLDILSLSSVKELCIYPQSTKLQSLSSELPGQQLQVQRIPKLQF